MSSLNRATILGNTGKDPEIRYTPEGKAIASFSVATTVRYRDKKTGERAEKTEWHRVAAFERLGEIVSEYVKKGSRIYIEGPLQTRKWTDKEGVERYSVQIVATKIVLLDGARAGEDHSTAPEELPAGVDGDDIPF
jgi:single-strand DNA-binding protein